MERVSTESELKKAINKKVSHIEVTGSLASKMKKLAPAFNLSSAKKAALGIALGTSLIPNPITKVSSAVAIKMTGKEIAAIILASGVSIAIIIAVLKDYNLEMKLDEQRVVLHRTSE